MNKQEYRVARAMIRANGNHTLHHMAPAHAQAMREVGAIQGRQIDHLAQRAAWRKSGMEASLAIRLR